MKNERRISVYTTNEDAKKLKIIAIQRGQTVTDLLNKAIRDIITNESIQEIIDKNTN